MAIHPVAPLLTFAAYQGAAVISATPATDAPSDPLAWLSTLGPFSIAISLSYFLLRRSDNREAAAERTHLEREQQLRSELLVVRQELAETRALLSHHRDIHPEGDTP